MDMIVIDNSLLRSVKLPTENGQTYLTRSSFKYFHYNCDGHDDVGWGCGYRTLQSLLSWIINDLKSKESNLSSTTTTSKNSCSNNLEITNSSLSSSSSSHSISLQLENSTYFQTSSKYVPTIEEIQTILVDISDKPSSFIGSREWIGILEVFYVIDVLFNLPCRILHVPYYDELKKYVNVVKKYFEDTGGLIMMGGDLDASSKGIAGVHISGNQAYFLIIDPHFVGRIRSPQELIEKNYIRWQHTSEFNDSSLYNLCLPQIKF